MKEKIMEIPETLDENTLELTKKNQESEKVEILISTFRWSIRTTSVGKKIESQIFSPKHDEQVRWKLRLCPNNGTEGLEDYLSLFLYLDHSDFPEMQVFFKCSILNRFNRNINRKAKVFYANPDNKRTAGFPDFVQKKTIYERYISPYGNFIVKCKVYAFARSETTPKVEDQLVTDLASLLESQKLTDVTLVASGKEIQAHKALLSARSEVFSKMFEHDMKEKQQNLVQIIDVDHNTMKEVLKYVYTGKLENVQENTSALLAAADKYQLDGMKSICVVALFANLTVGNAISTLMLADRYNVSSLKSRVIDFINGHAKQVINTPAFKSLSKAQAHLIMEAYCLLAVAFSREKKMRTKSNGRRRRRLKF